MVYDLTYILTTIAACSASIVAILGGFIASKLIAINAERDEVDTRISELDEEIAFYINEQNTLQHDLDEDDALDFIKDNIESIIEGRSLDEIYKEEERPRLPKDVLRPYWERGERAYQLLYDILSKQNNEDYEENDDGVPSEVAKRITDEFEYSICKKVCEFFERQQSPLVALSRNIGATIPASTWYADTTKMLNNIDSKIEWLTLQRKQQVTRRKSLKKPKGMKVGLALFALFSAVNIICPLSMSSFTTENYQYYCKIKTFSILVFGISLALIMLYLIYLLHWDNKKG